MSEKFVYLPSIGDLYYHHIYLYYDEPLVFSCATKAMQFYFAVAMPSASKEADSWLLTPISTGRLIQAEKNLIEIRELLTNPETVIYQVDLHESSIDVIPVLPDQLTDEMLPEAGEFLDFGEAIELMPSELTPIEQAHREMRDIIEISLEKDNSHIHELPCDIVADTLDNLQQLIYALKYKSGTIRGAIPQNIKADCQLSLTGMFAASLGIRLKSSELCNMFWETPLTSALIDLNNLFDVAGDQNKLKQFLSLQNPRVAYRFKLLIASLLQGNVGIRVNNASPNNSAFSKHFTTKELTESLALIESEIEERVERHTFSGKLVGVNVQRETFEFVTIENERIKGVIAKEICNRQYSVPQVAEAVIEMKIDQDSLSKTEKILYKLVSLTPIIPE